MTGSVIDLHHQPYPEAIAKWHSAVRSVLASREPSERADIMGAVARFGITTEAIIRHPIEAARAIEDLRREFSISEKDVEAAMRRQGIDVDAIDRELDAEIAAGKIRIMS